MNLKTFALAVKNMRANQKQYFKTRDKDVLAESKRSEALVDRYVTEILQEA